MKNSRIILPVMIIIGAIVLAGCSHAVVKTGSASESAGSEDNPLAFEEDENFEMPLYTDFTEELYSELLGKKPFAIFFYAGWCPDCVNLEKQIKANIEDFWSGSIILKADYDTESELKKKYGITVQSTVVIVKKNGEVGPTLFGPSLLDLKDTIADSL